MADRLDIVIFGATGFTGKHAILELHKLAHVDGRSLSWGVAGRSQEKLKSTLTEVEKMLGTNFESIPVIIADVGDEKSLQEMTGRARTIVNCCGPYRFYGEPVIKACLTTKTHHVDVSGEPQYMEQMQVSYHKQAEENGIYIVSACGLDSIPADLGLVFLEKNFEGTINSAEMYIKSSHEGDSTPGPSINYGTWHSAVYGLAHSGELRSLRSKLYPTRLPKFEPSLKPRGTIHKSDVFDGWCVPFPGSDRSVVLRSQRFFYDHSKKRPVQVQAYACIGSLFSVIVLAIFGGMFAFLAKYEFGRKLLLRYPGFFSGGFFSHDNPSEEAIQKQLYSIIIKGDGWSEKLSGPDDEYKTPPNKRITVKVSGRNPGYGMTCVALVLSGIMTLTETQNMPSSGGVYPPGAAFSETSLIEQLNKHGVKFEIVSVKDI